MSASAFRSLRLRMAEYWDLEKATALLAWDQQVMMPARGAKARAEQRATLNALAHAKLTDPEVGRLVDSLRDWGAAQPYDSLEASLIRWVDRTHAKARRVPVELEADLTRAAALANPIWVEARRNNDFAAFLPALRQNLDLKKRYVECFEPGDEVYDVLLDDYEPGLKTAEVRRIFDYLKEHQLPIVRELGEPVERLRGEFPRDRQIAFQLEVIRAFGYDDRAWRLDPTVHPFASSFSAGDIRLTTRTFETDLRGVFPTMHEFGHGLYEHQVDPALERTPLARGTSYALHESQSRTWENLVGRSRPFWRYWFPRLRELFGDQLAGYDVDRWYREINAVEPSLIRVESDEATYNFHIILRFELEQELLAGAFPLERLPEEWNRKMWEYLQVEVPDERRGVLQDTHWSSNSFGYFATYALGNLVSAQIWEIVTADLPDLDAAVEAGDFSPLREWLRENLHRHGRKFTPAETLERVTGSSEIDPEPYVRYLRQKLGDIYRIPTAGQ